MRMWIEKHIERHIERQTGCLRTQIPNSWERVSDWFCLIPTQEEESVRAAGYMKGELLMARSPWVLPQSYRMGRSYSFEDLRFEYISKKGICFVCYLLKWNKAQTLETGQFGFEILLTYWITGQCWKSHLTSLVLNFLIYEVKMIHPQGESLAITGHHFYPFKAINGYKCGT